MTFVRGKLLMERMNPGEIALFRINVGETLDNMPTSLAEQGFTILGCLPSDAENLEEPYLLQVLKPA